ncbi:hypothetical protein PR048_019862 [Dryococelus australis]|uniref:Uncharacterized protein n=1 Tax=Dryococelus australis TaxID=614101 RepID=A0ABQ9H4N6_9NEOP|nr:hypothetical protein PR048_019862 [Dryococelus australis]
MNTKGRKAEKIIEEERKEWMLKWTEVVDTRYNGRAESVCKAEVGKALKRIRKETLDNWRKGVIVPVFKKAITKKYEDYRQITGGWYIIDMNFAVQQLMEKKKSIWEGSGYAYDSVKQNVWQAMVAAGIEEELMCRVTTIYKEIKSCVRTGRELRDWFKQRNKVKQDYPLFPLLPSL